MYVRFEFTPARQWVPGFIRRLGAFQDKRITAVLKSYEQAITSWMKANARWQDRTGAARASLYAKAQGNSMKIGYGRQIYYSKYLEANPRYAILGDAADRWYGEIKRALKGALR
jgi:hypothetical protein